ncbi:MAG: aspartate kinase [Coriobacteriales bacterium]|nr:aspartate kinase [Coriobacteriaceae bacterium]MDD7203777.1 aspartate kinase [Coriobacteriaceae bacterium]MDY2723310.1 aspartate kinase [Coriobacteriales bacterium]MDY5661879.1 aspartate kinase [Coriobacteriales bacterium]
MSTVVAKFGGTSVATPERVINVARRIVERKRAGNRVVAVVSAMGKTTDDLIKLANSITDAPSPREMDTLLSTGEMVSMSLLAMAVESLGEKAISLSGRQIGLITDNVHGKASIREIHATRIKGALADDNIVIVAGFQGIDAAGDITTLGRGGSDTTAVAIAAGIKADVCEIYTDVDGVYTADPRIVPRAQKIDEISYEEMLEMAAGGAGVLHKRCVEFARNFGVVIHCRSSFNDEPGTLVKEMDPNMEKAIVSGVTHDLSEAKFTIRDVPDTAGVAATVFGAMADANLAVDMIIQNLSEQGYTDISFTSPKADAARTEEVMRKIVEDLGARELIVADNIAKVSIIGAGMKVNSGVAAKMFRTLADGDINISMISTSDIRTSVVIPADEAERAVRLLHTAFGLDGTKVFQETQLSAEELAAKANKGR